MVQQRCTERSAQMVATFTPVEAVTTDRALALLQSGHINAKATEKRLTLFCQHRLIVINNQPEPMRGIEHFHPTLTGQMIIADARLA